MLIAVLSVVPLGCSAFKTYEHAAALDEGRAAIPTITSAASVSGEVFVKTPAGEIRKGSDATIYLLPVTDYSREWYEHYIVRGERIGGKDPRSFHSAIATVVDREGRFQFRNIPPGNYYLTCSVEYSRPRFRMGRLQFGMHAIDRFEAYASVRLEPEQKLEVIVTRPVL